MKRVIGWSLIGLAIVSTQFACEGRSWKDWNVEPGVFAKPWDDDKKIQKIQQYHQEFGEIALSRPVVVSKPDRIKLDFQLTAKDIYNDIGIQAASRVGQFEAVSFRGAGKFEVPTIPEHTETPIGPAVGISGLQALVDAATQDPKPENLEILASVLKSALEAAKPLAEPVTIPARPPLGTPELPENIADARIKELSDAAKVFDPLPALRLNAVSRLTETANAHYHMRLHELFSDVDQIKAADSEEPVLLAGFITICPGSITEGGYVAETLVSIYLEYNNRNTPVPVVSLFPSAIGQNLDLQSLFALQRSLALKMQAAGYVFGGAGQFDWAKLDQLNTRSLNQRVTVSSFNRGHSNQIGWRVRGEYWAASDSAKWKGRLINPGDAVLMQDVSLPTLMVALIPKEVKAISQAAQEAVKTIAELEELLKPAPAVETKKLKAWRKRFIKLIEKIKDIDVPVVESTKQLYMPPNSWIEKNEILAKMVETRLTTAGATWDLEDFEKPLDEAKTSLDLWIKDGRPFIRFDIGTNWIPENSQEVASYPELSAREGYYRAQVADRLSKNATAEADKGISGTYEHTWNCVIPESMLNGISPALVCRVPFPIDPPKEGPTIRDFYPTTLPFDRASALLVTGSNFQKDMRVLVGPLAATVLAVSSRGNAAVVAVDPSGVSSHLPMGGKVRVMTAVGTSELSANELTFVETPRRSEQPKTTFEFKKNGKTERTLEVIESLGGAKPDALKSINPCDEKPCKDMKVP